MHFSQLSCASYLHALTIKPLISAVTTYPESPVSSCEKPFHTMDTYSTYLLLPMSIGCKKFLRVFGVTWLNWPKEIFLNSWSSWLYHHLEILLDLQNFLAIGLSHCFWTKEQFLLSLYMAHIFSRKYGNIIILGKTYPDAETHDSDIFFPSFCRSHSVHISAPQLSYNLPGLWALLTLQLKMSMGLVSHPYTEIYLQFICWHEWHAVVLESECQIEMML